MEKRMEDLFNEFKRYKVDIEGRSVKSIDNYIVRIKSFCEDMNIEDYETLITANAQIVRDWLSILAEKGNSSVSRNAKLSHIKQLYQFLEDEKEIPIDRKILKIKFSKTEQKETKYMDKYEIENLLMVIKNARVKAATSIIATTGVRFSELMQITCTDIERGYAIITGKGRKERKIWFSPSCQRICFNFIYGDRKNIVKKSGVETDLLFINNNGNLMTRESYAGSLKMYSRKMGLYWSEEMSPHKIRHSFVTEKLNENIPIQIVRDAVGHSNVAVTDRYAHSKEEDVKKLMLNEYNQEKDEEDYYY